MKKTMRRTNSSVIDHGNYATKPKKRPAEDLLESATLKKHASSAPPSASPSSQPLGDNPSIPHTNPSLNVAYTLPLAGSSAQASNPAVVMTQGAVQSPMSSLEDHIPIKRGVQLFSKRPRLTKIQREAEAAAEKEERAAKAVAIATERENERARKEVQEAMKQNERDEKEKRARLNQAAMDTITVTKGASQVLESITKVAVSAGGGGFETFHAFMDTFLTSNNPDISCWVTNYCRQNDAALIQLINDQAPDAALEGSLGWAL